MKSNITRPLAFALALLANFFPIVSAENKTLDKTLVGEQASKETMLKVFGHSAFSEFSCQRQLPRRRWPPHQARHLSRLSNLRR